MNKHTHTFMTVMMISLFVVAIIGMNMTRARTAYDQGFNEGVIYGRFEAYHLLRKYSDKQHAENYKMILLTKIINDQRRAIR